MYIIACYHCYQAFELTLEADFSCAMHWGTHRFCSRGCLSAHLSRVHKSHLLTK